MKQEMKQKNYKNDVMVFAERTEDDVMTAAAYPKTAFTLAEVLITLGIIGIVAAMTIPTLIANYEKKQTVAKLQKVVSILGQMMTQSYADNGPASFLLKSGAVVSAATTKEFFDTYWLPYFKSPVVSKDGVYPYSTKNPYTYLTGTNTNLAILTKYSDARIYFTTSDGTSYFDRLLEWSYEYDEEGNKISTTGLYTKQQIYVDLNGTKDPNTIGKDVFVFLADFDANRILPYCYSKTSSYINSNCSASGNGVCCSSKIINDGWRISDDYPW